MNSQSRIVCNNDGPYRVEGVKVILDAAGKNIAQEKLTLLCRCGKSKKMPLCDNSHSLFKFTAVRGKSKLPNKRINYRGKEILVHFNPSFCSHDGTCLRMLPKVFSQSQNPWVKPDAGFVEKIIEVIKKCPSGALSYSLAGEGGYDCNDESIIKTIKYGPLNVSGKIILIDNDLGELKPESADRYSLCRCGLTSNTPYCDGSHFVSDMDI